MGQGLYVFELIFLEDAVGFMVVASSISEARELVIVEYDEIDSEKLEQVVWRNLGFTHPSIPKQVWLIVPS